jgi:hypothetical protein
LASGSLFGFIAHCTGRLPQSFGGGITIFASLDAIQFGRILVVFAAGMAELFCIANQASLDMAAVGQLLFLWVLEG